MMAFPSYPVQMDHPSLSVGMPTCPKADRHLLGGPDPAPGTPQGRFAATLGLSHKPNGPAGINPIGQPMTAMDNPPPFQPTQNASLSPMIYNHNQVPFDMFKQGNYSVKGSGKGPTRPLPGSPATQWLSYECQRRHFNPDIHVVQKADGSYRCTIVIQNHVVQSNKSFPDAQAAKVHTASKAYGIVQKWPKSGYPPDMYATSPEKAVGKKAVAMGTDREGHDPLRRQQELRAQLLKNKQGKDGEQRSQTKEVGSRPTSAGLPSSEVDMTNPIEARAFVEGFKMGQLAAMRDAQAAAEVLSPPPMSNKGFTWSRSRSPSRSTKGDRNHRHRSPFARVPQPIIKREQTSVPPRYHDGSRRDPSLPSTDRYRPRLLSKDPNFGRLN